MSSASQPFDPYRSPTLPEGPYSPQPATSGRPGWLTTLCVLAIVIGALGLMNAALGAFGAIAGPALQKAIQPKANVNLPKGMQDAQEEFQDNVNAVQAKYMWGTIPALVFRAISAVLLLVGGIRSLSLNENGRQLLLVACCVAVVFELLHAILQSVIAMDMMTVVNSYVEKLMVSMPQNNRGPDMSKIMPAFVRWTIIGSLIFAFLIALFKIALYTFAIVYLRKPHIQALFQGKPAATMSLVS